MRDGFIYEKAQPFNPRQHMLVQSFEIFRYCDSHLDGVELHHHDFFEVYFFLSGNVNYSIESHNYPLVPGDLLLISPLELHQPRIAQEQQPYERIVLWINKSFIRQFTSVQTDLTRCFDSHDPNHTNLLHCSPVQREIVRRLMERLLHESHSNEYGGDLAAVGILVQLLVEINRMTQEAARQNENADKSATVITQVVRYISEHFDEELSLDKIANVFYISKYHLLHEFKRMVGTSVYHYIIQKRLVIARQMLSDGVTPTDVYRHCGFGDYANFYRAFKAEYHITPKELSEIVHDKNR